MTKSEIFPAYVYCFTCHSFSLLSDIEDGTLIKCPKCKGSSVHSCWWIMYHHKECFFNLEERNVTIQCFSIYEEIYMNSKSYFCKDCRHRFFCWTNRCENDWDYEALQDKGWDVLPRSAKTRAVVNSLGNHMGGAYCT